MKKSSQRGFGFVVVLAVIVMVGLVAFAAVRVMGNNTSLADSGTLTSKAKVPSRIESSADLQKASQALDETPVDNGVNPDSLDSDLNSLL